MSKGSIRQELEQLQSLLLPQMHPVGQQIVRICVIILCWCTQGPHEYLGYNGFFCLSNLMYISPKLNHTRKRIQENIAPT